VIIAGLSYQVHNFRNRGSGRITNHNNYSQKSPGSSKIHFTAISIINNNGRPRILLCVASEKRHCGPDIQNEGTIWKELSQSAEVRDILDGLSKRPKRKTQQFKLSIFCEDRSN